MPYVGSADNNQAQQERTFCRHAMETPHSRGAAQVRRANVSVYDTREITKPFGDELLNNEGVRRGAVLAA